MKREIDRLLQAVERKSALRIIGEIVYVTCP